MLLTPEVDSGAQPYPVRQGMLVLGAAPDDEANPGRGLGLVGHPEGQAVEKDYFLGRSGVDVAVRREGDAEVRVPTAPGADGVKVALHVLHYGCGRFAGQHALEMLPGQLVLSLEEEGSGQLEARPAQVGLEDQNASQRRDGGVQQGLSGLVIEAGSIRRADARQSRQQENFHIVRIDLQQRPEKFERIEVASIMDQFFGILDAGLQRSRHQQKNG